MAGKMLVAMTVCSAPPARCESPGDPHPDEWDENRLNQVSADEWARIHERLDALARANSLPTIEGDETIQLVREAESPARLPERGRGRPRHLRPQSGRRRAARREGLTAVSMRPGRTVRAGQSGSDVRIRSRRIHHDRELS